MKRGALGEAFNPGSCPAVHPLNCLNAAQGQRCQVSLHGGFVVSAWGEPRESSWEVPGAPTPKPPVATSGCGSQDSEAPSPASPQGQGRPDHTTETKTGNLRGFPRQALLLNAMVTRSSRCPEMKPTSREGQRCGQ